jgi:hypothetical protein
MFFVTLPDTVLLVPLDIVAIGIVKVPLDVCEAYVLAAEADRVDKLP